MAAAARPVSAPAVVEDEAPAEVGGEVLAEAPRVSMQSLLADGSPERADAVLLVDEDDPRAGLFEQG